MRKFLMITSAILGLGCLYPTTISAQTCTAAPSCADMGYTKTVSDCTGKTTLKCPFDLSAVSCEEEDSSSSSGGGEWDWDRAVYCYELDYTEITLEGVKLYKMPLGLKGCYVHLGPGNYSYSMRGTVLDAEDNLLISPKLQAIYGPTTICVDDKTTVAYSDFVTSSSSAAYGDCKFIPYKGVSVTYKESCEVGDYYHDNGRCSSDSLGMVGAIGIVVDAENRKIVYMKARSQVFATNVQDFNNLYSSLKSTTDGEGNTDKLIAAGVDKFPAVKYCNDLTVGNLKWYIPASKEVDFSSFDFSKIGCSYPSSSTAYSSSSVAMINSSAGRVVTYEVCYPCIAKY